MTELGSIKTVQREVWESYQCHVVDRAHFDAYHGNIPVHPRLMLSWYEMLGRVIAAMETEEGEGD